MRLEPKIIVICDGNLGDGYYCQIETEVTIPFGETPGPYLDDELDRRGWTYYYSDLDFCPKCDKERNHVILKGIIE